MPESATKICHLIQKNKHFASLSSEKERYSTPRSAQQNATPEEVAQEKSTPKMWPDEAECHLLPIISC